MHIPQIRYTFTITVRLKLFQKNRNFVSLKKYIKTSPLIRSLLEERSWVEVSNPQHMTHYFIIPGYQGSGADHWQTWIESTQPNFHRIEQRDWENPNLTEWAENIDKAIAGYDPESVVLVAHSLGCLTVAEWVKRYNRSVKAAMLVAPPDVVRVNERIGEDLIEGEPTQHIPFPTTLVASTNDPWISIERAQYFAQHWGSEFINIGEAGHINNLSGFGVWEEGLEILKKLG